MPRPPLSAQYGKRAKEARRLAGLSQREMAKAMGMGFRSYNYFETGERRLCLEDLVRLCYITGVTADWILGLSADPWPRRVARQSAPDTGPVGPPSRPENEQWHDRAESALANFEKTIALPTNPSTAPGKLDQPES
jgi:transcriptional regulator with XRE-family HTH domain